MTVKTASLDAPADRMAAMVAELSASYAAYSEQEEAIYYGRATELTGCYLCPGEPLRGIADRGVTGGSDPTELLTLAPCGHKVI